MGMCVPRGKTQLGLNRILGKNQPNSNSSTPINQIKKQEFLDLISRLDSELLDSDIINDIMLVQEAKSEQEFNTKIKELPTRHLDKLNSNKLSQKDFILYVKANLFEKFIELNASSILLNKGFDVIESLKNIYQCLKSNENSDIEDYFYDVCEKNSGTFDKFQTIVNLEFSSQLVEAFNYLKEGFLSQLKYNPKYHFEMLVLSFTYEILTKEELIQSITDLLIARVEDIQSLLINIAPLSIASKIGTTSDLLSGILSTKINLDSSQLLFSDYSFNPQMYASLNKLLNTAEVSNCLKLLSLSIQPCISKVYLPPEILTNLIKLIEKDNLRVLIFNNIYFSSQGIKILCHSIAKLHRLVAFALNSEVSKQEDVELLKASIKSNKNIKICCLFGIKTLKAEVDSLITDITGDTSHSSYFNISNYVVFKDLSKFGVNLSKLSPNMLKDNQNKQNFSMEKLIKGI